ncbi:ATP-binding protein (plasmid) [Photobacterium sp. GJ3]|uniref:ATP-binding protein n=1 Tax=Photobacterium sp. GJ3 TaxID=2829502 RepID=UPI001B8B1ADB|nr:ATP-binding protein [Photobacterium sp. GJ3]QUJ69634.1 ATP-binding protein [Photobacterium sp. GJ3]
MMTSLQQFPISQSRSHPQDEGLRAELAWCQALFQARLDGEPTHLSLSAPDLSLYSGPYADFIRSCQFSVQSRLLICLGLVPIVLPQMLEHLLQSYEEKQQPFSELGFAEFQGTLWPTGQTLAFLLGDDPIQSRRLALQVLSGQFQTDLLPLFVVESSEEGGSRLWQKLRLKEDVVAACLCSDAPLPQKEPVRYASLLTTPLAWEALVLPSAVLGALDEIELWLCFGQALESEWQLAGKIRSGFRALFYGPPGTGKSMTAALLGKKHERPVYRVDLSAVVSKYIGETEKNLSQLFQQAEQQGWILFFDEADALFGQRVQTAGANDQFANQNVAYLLQRIESFTGIIILATNLQENLDSAFFRRFETTVHFPLPDASVRLTLWEHALPATKRGADVDLSELASQYPLSGAEIVNVVRYAALKAMSRSASAVRLDELQTGIRQVTTFQAQRFAGKHAFFQSHP